MELVFGQLNTDILGKLALVSPLDINENLVISIKMLAFEGLVRCLHNGSYTLSPRTIED